MLRKYLRLAVITISFIITLSGIMGCSLNEEPLFDIAAVTTYHNIPGITDWEIEAIDALRKERDYLSYATLSSLEAFVNEDGQNAGYSALLCELLTDLFGIPFVQEYHIWENIQSGINDHSIDFTGMMTPTPERIQSYYMSTPIAQRTFGVYYNKNSSIEIVTAQDLDGMRVGKLKESITDQIIREGYPQLVIEAIDITDLNEAAESLRIGEIDAFVLDSTDTIDFLKYDFIGHADILPFIYAPVSLATGNPALEPIITVFNKYIAAGGIDILYEIYKKGEVEYARFAFLKSLTDSEKDYLGALAISGSKVPVALESNNYPLSFFNEQEKEFQGIAVDILDEISKLTGIEFHVTTNKGTTWTEIYEDLLNGRVSLVSQLIYSEERAENFIWPEQPYCTTRFAFLSKTDYQPVSMFQVVHTTVGITRNSAYAEMYQTWFLDDKNVIYYNSSQELFDALESGRIDLALASENVLLRFTNYREMPGYKANLIIPSPWEESYFGLHKNETQLCSIISKATLYIDTTVIENDWKSRTFDYSRKIAETRTKYMAVFLILVLSLLIVVSFYLFQNNKKRNIISDLLEKTKNYSEYELMKHHLTVEALDVALWDKDINVNHLSHEDPFSLDSEMHFSKKLRQLLGFEDEQDFPDLLSSWVKQVHPDDKEEAMKALMVHICDLTGNTPYDAEYRMIRKDGTCGYFRSFGETLRGEGGVPIRIAGAIKDITEQKQMEEALREAESRAKLMLDSGPLCCLLWDRNYNVFDCNQASMLLFGYDEKQKYLENWAKETSPKYQPDGLLSTEKSRMYLKKAFNEGYCTFEWMHQTPDGEPIPTEVTLVRINYKDDSIVAAYTRDLRIEKKLQDEVKKAMRTLEEALKEKSEAVLREREANQIKSRFLATVSHEIRTPMNAIIGMTELALREEDKAIMKEHIFEAKQAGSSLLAIISDILDFSKIEAGKLDIIPVNYSVSALINNMISIIKIRLIDSRIDFVVRVDSSIPETLYGDETRIRQAILNVLNNAVKYTEKGFLSFTVQGETIDDDTIHITFEVTDTGIGIQQENIEKLFYDFTQFDIERNRSVEGVGLGLAISHNLVKEMDGAINVASVYGKGSTFTITLPQKIRSHKPLAEVEQPNKKRVLIYEKREIYKESMIYAIKNLAVNHTLVNSGTELYELMERQTFDFLFISYELYKKNKETIKEFGSNTKVAILTGIGETITEKGVSVLAMPIYGIHIADVMNGVYGKANFAVSDVLNIRFSASDVKVLVVDDIQTNLKVVEGLLMPYEMRVDLCSSGTEAIEILQKIHDTQEKRYDLIFMDHKMPGMDGVEATRLIRAMGDNDPYYKEVPIIALTANVVSGMAEMFIENGFNDFLPKPIDTTELKLVLENWIV